MDNGLRDQDNHSLRDNNETQYQSITQQKEEQSFSGGRGIRNCLSGNLKEEAWIWLTEAEGFFLTDEPIKPTGEANLSRDDSGGFTF